MRRTWSRAALAVLLSVLGCGSSGDDSPGDGAGDAGEGAAQRDAQVGDGAEGDAQAPSGDDGAEPGDCSELACIDIDGKRGMIVDPSPEPTFSLPVSDTVYMQQWQLGTQRSSNFVPGEAFVFLSITTTKDLATADVTAADVSLVSLGVTHTVDDGTNQYHKLELKDPAQMADAQLTFTASGGKVSFSVQGVAVNDQDKTMVDMAFSANELSAK